MLKYLDVFLENSFILFNGTALILALFRYPMYFDTPLKYYPILLMYTFLNETLGYFIRLNENFNPLLTNITDILDNNNILIYNIYNFIFTFYFIYIYWHFAKKSPHKKLLAIFAFIYILTSILNFSIQNFLLQNQIISYFTGALIIIYSSIMNLKENKGVLRKKIAKQSLLYWISIGLLIFFTGYLPIKTYYALSAFEDTTVYLSIRRVHHILVGTMYCFIIFGFIQMKGKLKV